MKVTHIDAEGKAQPGYRCYVCSKYQRDTGHTTFHLMELADLGGRLPDGLSWWMCGACLATAINDGKLQLSLTIEGESLATESVEQPAEDSAFEVSW